MKHKNLIPLKDLNLTSRFLFDVVAEDPDAHEAMLGIILGRDIHLSGKNQTEKEFLLSPSIRSIRMDVFSLDEEETVYNTEMQNKLTPDIPKRSRYYQSLMDTSLLEAGSVDYNELNNSCIIMIMTFDLFGYGKYMYTFVPRCIEAPDCRLEDGTIRIFLNTKGTNKDEVSQELIDFLHYVEHTTDETAEQSDSERLRRIHNRVCKVRKSEEIGVRYMQAWEEKIYERREAREEGRIEGREEGRIEGEQAYRRELVGKMIKKGKSIDEIADLLGENTETIQSIAEETEDMKQN